MLMTIEEFSKFIDVPLLRSGTFTPRNTGGQTITYTDEDIDALAHDSNEAMDLIRESIGQGAYRGNEQIPLMKQIPGLINILHQDYIPTDTRKAMKDVAVTFGTQVKDGIKWLVGTFSDVPHEWAKLIKDKFPFRSVEVLADITHPDTGKHYPKLIRSVGFLDYLTKPAVGGQSPELAVEFSADDNSHVTTLYSQTIPLKPQGEIEMAENQEVKADVVETPKDKPKDREAVSTVEFQEALATQEKKIVEMQAKIEDAEKEKAVMKAMLANEQKVREDNEIEMFCKALVHEHHASPAFIDLVKPQLGQADSHTLIEFAEGEKKSQRQALQEVFQKMLTMKKEDVVSVPVGEYAKATHDPPEEQPEAVEDRQNRRIAEFVADAKMHANNPEDQDEVWQRAYDLALATYGDKL